MITITSQGKIYNLNRLNDRNALLDKISLFKKNKQAQNLEEIASQINQSSFTTAIEQTFYQKAVAIIPHLIKISDKALYPRSEYCARFIGTTAFLMDNPEYWGSYHRSEATRFFDNAGGRVNTQIMSDNFLQKPGRVNSFFAHTGGIRNPYSSTVADYQTSIKQTQIAPLGKNNVRDNELRYRRLMAEQVVKSFTEEATKNELKLLKKGCSKASITRPIVFYENEYPCVLVNSPILSSAEFSDDSSKYWSKNPKPMQRLLLASFVALVNIEAKKAGIPIETVIRSSFGHNLPSVCETNNTFRINVGIIPKQYAVILGKSLHKLNQVFSALKETNINTAFDQSFLTAVRKYNAKKLKKAINEKDRYKSLRKNRDYLKAENSQEALDALHQAVKKIDKAQRTATGRANFTLVELKDMSVWKIISQPGDTKGRPLLAELFRHNKVVDWFVNMLMDKLLNNEPQPIESALIKLLGYLKYDTKVTMDYKKIDSDLKKASYQFDNLSFESIYKKDPAFAKITNDLFESFCAKRPNEGLYAALDHASSHFFTAYRGSDELQTDPDSGSESEFSEDLAVVQPKKPPQKEVVNKYHFSHSKLRVCSGMKSIVLAHYAALSFLKEKKITSYKLDVEQMYYEVEDALRMVKKIGLHEFNMLRKSVDNMVMYFDLNHCNSSNSNDNKTLTEKLNLVKKTSVAILDYTSSTHAEVELALKQCLANNHISLVILVNSDLKNNQGGADLNPYGEIRIVARDRQTRQQVITSISAVLSEKDKLSQRTHEMIRASKKRGLAFSMHGFFKAENGPYQNNEAAVIAPRVIN